MSDLCTYEFQVWTMPLALQTNEVKTEPFEAAYFQEQGLYTLFKDAAHVAVSAFKTELVTRIVRSEEPVD